VTINVVRQRVAEHAEIVKVVPISRPVTAEAPGGLSFALLVLTADDEARLAEVSGVDRSGITPIAAILQGASSLIPEPALHDEDEDDDDRATPGAPRRNVLRVDVARVDDAMERLSALIVTRSRLARAVADLTAVGANTAALIQIVNDHARQVRDLRSSILRVRMIPVADVLERVPLIVRAMRRSSGKSVKLEIATSKAELDKSVADRVFPAIVHLVRNAIDHGIEPAEERRRAGKPEEGSLLITCIEHASSRLEIAIADDGGGIDRVAVARHAGTEVPTTDAALLEILCRAGLSTRSEVTTTSGRGMGMDIVKRIVVDQLGGELLVKTEPGRGTTFVLHVPLTVSIVDAFTLECAGQRFVVPVSMVEELVEVEPDKVVYGPTPLTGSERRGVGMLHRRGEAVPLIELATALRLERPKERARKALVVRRAGEPIAFGLDRVLGQQEAVVRPLEDPLVQVPGIAGATDLGDGRPTLVLDLLSLGARLSELGTERVV
ncbi:MAG: chemotaxis protein CheW, partial [Polyangiales bacterium]